MCLELFTVARKPPNSNTVRVSKGSENMKKTLSVLTLGIAASLALSGCGSAPTNAPSSSSSAGAAAATDNNNGGSFKACMVSDAGGFNDKSFNESGKNGLDKAVADLSIQSAVAESSKNSDFTPNLNAMVTSKCNIIIGVGFLMGNAMGESALANKDTNFALVDAPLSKDNKPIEVPNGKPLIFDTVTAAYLAGYAAASVSKSGILATYLGMNIPTTAIFADGFVDGVARYNKDFNKNVKVLGWDKEAQTGANVGNFDDIAKGKTFTEKFIEQGADVILPVAGPIGLGTLQAVKEANKNGKEVAVVWVDADGVLTNPDYKDIIITSIMKQIGEAVYASIQESKDGKFTNAPYVGTLENKGVDIAPFHEFESKIPDEVKANLKQIRADIISGKLKVESKNSPKAN